ncbi:MAG: HAD-IA family hydrolase [Blautia sp.]|jgi:HAD superfamily hydrolase (TIGR01549 family)
MYRAILFDLDGTLTASGEGITKCVQYAMSKFGIYEPDLHKLEVFIGPPLVGQFMKYCGFTEAQARQAVEYYRERYTDVGIFENEPYPGIGELLAELKRKGYLLAVASSKPTKFVLKVLEHFGLTGYFHEIVGAEMDGSRTQKAEVIEEALRRLGMEDQREDVIMVGDKEHDVYGARQMGLKCVAVTYGYGTLEELTKANPYYFAESVEQLREFFLSGPLREQSVPRKIFRTVYPIGIHFILTQVVALLFLGIYMAVTGKSNTTGSTLLILAVVSLLVIPISLLLMRMDDRLRGHRGNIWKISLTDGILTFLLGMAYGQIGNTALGFLELFHKFPGYDEMMSQVLENQSFFLMLLSMGILAPIAEELIFRGLVYRRLKDYLSPTAALIISSVAFGIYHGNMIQFLYATFVGMLFVLLMERSGSLWGSILAHMGANIWSVILTCFGNRLMEAAGGLVLSMLVLAMFVGGIFGILYLKPSKKRM